MIKELFTRYHHRNDVLPGLVDRLIIHQFDPANASPGGIDTCIRGLLRYADSGTKIAVVGVDAGPSNQAARIGSWEVHRFGEVEFSFLPVAKFDPANQGRIVPHSLRLAMGTLWNSRKLPRAEITQTHRADLGAFARACIRGPQAYFIHTQKSGLTNAKSDSFWKHASKLHEWFETRVVANATQVAVFNPDYAETMQKLNPDARFSPTWYDPALVCTNGIAEPRTILWVGRMEIPKDPELAIEAFSKLPVDQNQPPWRLRLIGDGQLSIGVASAISKLPPEVASRIEVCGRQEPWQVADSMATADIFLMTSHPGYEGYPRVLVEAMANGLKPVVTSGSDTGSLIDHGINGYVARTRDANELAELISLATSIDAASVTRTVKDLDAPSVVKRLIGTRKKQ